MEPEGRANAQRAVGRRAPRVALGGQPLAIEELHVPEVEAFLVDAQSLAEHRDLVRPVGDVDPAVGLDVAGEIFLGDELSHALARVDAEPEDAPRGRQPPPGLALLERELAERDHREAAVAPRGAPSDLVRLQDDGVEPVIAGEPVGGGEPGVPAAEDRHVARSGRRGSVRAKRAPGRGRCPVGGDVSAHRRISAIDGFPGPPDPPGRPATGYGGSLRGRKHRRQPARHSPRAGNLGAASTRPCSGPSPASRAP